MDAPVGWLVQPDAVNVNSQFGEDGLLRETFSRIGFANRYAFEVGAADGRWLSNTRRLIDDEGFVAVLIEADAERYARLESTRTESEICVHREIGPDDLDDILDDVGVPVDLDLGSIDVDGQDYWVWHGLRRYRPRVMVVEYRPRGDDDFIPPKGGDKRSGQAPLSPIVELGRSKGYIALGRTHCNVLFLREDLVP